MSRYFGRINYLPATCAFVGLMFACGPLIRRGIFHIRTGSLQAPPLDEAEPITATKKILIFLNTFAMVYFALIAYSGRRYNQRRAAENEQRRNDEARGIYPVVEIQQDESFNHVGMTREGSEQPPEMLRRVADRFNDNI